MRRKTVWIVLRNCFSASDDHYIDVETFHGVFATQPEAEAAAKKKSEWDRTYYAKEAVLGSTWSDGSSDLPFDDVDDEIEIATTNDQEKLTAAEINSRHSDAMEHVDVAMRCKREGDEAAAKKVFRYAFELEREAAEAVVANFPNQEPSRSVLLRSAATLAVDCGQLDEAMRLLKIGMEGNPPAEIVAEMCELACDVMKAAAK